MENDLQLDHHYVLRALELGINVAKPDWPQAYSNEILSLLKEDFDALSDPHEKALIPWTALKVAVEFRIDVPSWIIDHLYKAGELIHEESLSEADAKDRLPARIGKALGFSASGRGKTPIGTVTRNSVRDMEIAAFFHSRIMFDAVSKTVAYGDAANHFDLSEKTVLSAVKKWGSVAEARVKALSGLVLREVDYDTGREWMIRYREGAWIRIPMK